MIILENKFQNTVLEEPIARVSTSRVLHRKHTRMAGSHRIEINEFDTISFVTFDTF